MLLDLELLTFLSFWPTPTFSNASFVPNSFLVSLLIPLLILPKLARILQGEQGQLLVISTQLDHFHVGDPVSELSIG
ncbi:hypothetical protein F4781DRAFT_410295 [Annulohypoxylon bovei var. microspora]|nr:hypothetical protein F4781DRAFT_410295 [Annulohypoxylon bovei var. microspora]